MSALDPPPYRALLRVPTLPVLGTDVRPYSHADSRIDFSQSPSEVLEIYSRPILPLALQHNLTLVAANGTTLHKGGQGVITIRTSAEKGLAPAPVTPVSGTAWVSLNCSSSTALGQATG